MRLSTAIRRGEDACALRGALSASGNLMANQLPPDVHVGLAMLLWPELRKPTGALDSSGRPMTLARLLTHMDRGCVADFVEWLEKGGAL